MTGRTPPTEAPALGRLFKHIFSCYSPYKTNSQKWMFVAPCYARRSGGSSAGSKLVRGRRDAIWAESCLGATTPAGPSQAHASH